MMETKKITQYRIMYKEIIEKFGIKAEKISIFNYNVGEYIEVEVEA